MVRLFLCATCLSTSLYAYLVHTCPTTRVTWIARSNVIKCNIYREELYHCFRNSSGELEEHCRKSEVVDPSKGCPYFNESNRLMYFRCRGGLRCPKRGDPYFYTSELFLYPGCLQRLTKTTLTRTSVPVSTPMVNTDDDATLASLGSISTHGLLSDNVSKHDHVFHSSTPMLYLWIGFGALVVTIISFATCNILKRKRSVMQKQPNETARSIREETRVFPPHDVIDQDPRICSELNFAPMSNTVSSGQMIGYEKFCHSNMTEKQINKKHSYEGTENESIYVNDVICQDQYRRQREYLYGICLVPKKLSTRQYDQKG